jgi:hypothetical protein
MTGPTFDARCDERRSGRHSARFPGATRFDEPACLRLTNQPEQPPRKSAGASRADAFNAVAGANRRLTRAAGKPFDARFSGQRAECRRCRVGVTSELVKVVFQLLINHLVMPRSIPLRDISQTHALTNLRALTFLPLCAPAPRAASLTRRPARLRLQPNRHRRAGIPTRFARAPSQQRRPQQRTRLALLRSPELPPTDC